MSLCVIGDARIADGSQLRAAMTSDIIRIDANEPTFQISGARGEAATLVLQGSRWWEPASSAKVTVGSRTYTIERKGGMFKRHFDFTDDQGATVEAHNKSWLFDFSIPVGGQQYRFCLSGWTGKMSVLGENDNRIAEISHRLTFGPKKGRASFAEGAVTTTHLLLALIAYYLLKVVESESSG